MPEDICLQLELARSAHLFSRMNPWLSAALLGAGICYENLLIMYTQCLLDRKTKILGQDADSDTAALVYVESK